MNIQVQPDAKAVARRLPFEVVALVLNEPQRREVADKFAEYRTIRAGVECWQAIGRAESFEARRCKSAATTP